MIYWKDFIIGDEFLGSYLAIEREGAGNPEDPARAGIMDDALVEPIQETGQKQRPARMAGSEKLPLGDTAAGRDAGRAEPAPLPGLGGGHG